METLLPVSSRSLQYYVIAKRWSSDLEFFRLETDFLRQLLDRYISRLQDVEHLHKLVKAAKYLADLQKLEVDELLAGQLTQLELMAEDVIPEDAHALASSQMKLEQFITGLTQKFRALKQEIFQLVLDTRYGGS